MAINKSVVMTILFTIAMILCRIGSFVASPLWLDSLSNTSSSTSNASHDQKDINAHTICPFYIVFITTSVPMLFFGICLGLTLLFKPALITNRERSYPKYLFFVPGFLQASSSILINYSFSGTRTAPYLQALLNNFNIPIQFSLRFLFLRKYPTKRKILCTVFVMIAEFVCLLPSIVPSLETAQQHKNDGGASGAGRILWPLCFVMSMVPYSITNVYIEKSVKDKGKDSDILDSGKLNMVYYLFWYTLAFTLGGCMFFWVDIIPGFGTSSSMKEFGEKFWFNLACSFGQQGCGPDVYLLGWIVILTSLLAYPALSYLLRYSEGANYMIVAMALRSPILFLVWTLFHENPFYWYPHTDLSTWLSIGALCIMVPSVIIYNTGPPERFKPVTPVVKEVTIQNSDRAGLLAPAEDNETD